MVSVLDSAAQHFTDVDFVDPDPTVVQWNSILPFSDFQTVAWNSHNISTTRRVWFPSVQARTCSSSDIKVGGFRNAESSYSRWVSICISLFLQSRTKIRKTACKWFEFEIFINELYSRESAIAHVMHTHDLHMSCTRMTCTLAHVMHMHAFALPLSSFHYRYENLSSGL